MPTRPIAVYLLAAFFDIASLIVLAVGIALTWPGTAVDMVWDLHPSRRAELMPHASWMGPMFLALFAAFSAASIGVLLQRRWGWMLAVAIFGANLIGDIVQLAMGHALEGAIGIAVSGAILYWLCRPKVRAMFGA